jgi:site-specific DNA-methyltransferase (adenine-specific)
MTKETVFRSGSMGKPYTAIAAMQLVEQGIIRLEYQINNYLNLVFRKDFSAQVLKANMRVVGNAEYGLILYRDKLPKFNNNGKMIFNVMDWESDTKDVFYEKIHPTQKPVKLLEKLISIFTDPGDVVIDPVAGSGSTLIAAHNLGRKGYGFEIKKDFYKQANEWIKKNETAKKEIKELGYSPTLLKLKKDQYNLFEKVPDANNNP